MFVHRTPTTTAMKKTLIAVTLSLAAMGCFAAPPSDESIRSLFKVMKAESLMDSVYANLEPAMRQAMVQASAGKTLSEEQKRVMERAPQRLSEVLRSELSWAKMEPMQIAIYRDSFEQAEVDGLIAFYKSPLGQSFVNKMPMVTQKAMTAMQATMQQVMPRIKAAMDEVLAEAKLAPPK
jgi:hypothetical protein